MKPLPNCSTWPCATSPRNGPSAPFPIGPRRSTASAFSTRAACRLTDQGSADRRWQRKWAMETVEKQTTFSHRSHSPYCDIEENYHPTIYTKYLTPPNEGIFLLSSFISHWRDEPVRGANFGGAAANFG